MDYNEWSAFPPFILGIAIAIVLSNAERRIRIGSMLAAAHVLLIHSFITLLSLDLPAAEAAPPRIA
ncbi:MAG: hypothetical protein HC848_05875 [Limnobacter sp.]|nr:hypothetical protein [Limnobacter sp.]